VHFPTLRFQQVSRALVAPRLSVPCVPCHRDRSPKRQFL